MRHRHVITVVEAQADIRLASYRSCRGGSVHLKLAFLLQFLHVFLC